MEALMYEQHLDARLVGQALRVPSPSRRGTLRRLVGPRARAASRCRNWQPRRLHYVVGGGDGQAPPSAQSSPVKPCQAYRLLAGHSPGLSWPSHVEANAAFAAWAVVPPRPIKPSQTQSDHIKAGGVWPVPHWPTNEPFWRNLAQSAPPPAGLL